MDGGVAMEYDPEMGRFYPKAENPIRKHFREQLILNAPPVPNGFGPMFSGEVFGDDIQTSINLYMFITARSARWAIAFADAVLAQLDAEGA